MTSPPELTEAPKIFFTGDATDSHIKLLVAGPAGSGKTRLVRSWPNPFVITAEGLLDSIRKDRIPATNVANTAELDYWLDRLEIDDPELRTQMMAGLNVETVSFDTLDEIGHLYMTERLRYVGREKPNTDDYVWVGTKMRTLLSRIRRLPLNVICTVHVRERDSDDGPRVMAPDLVGSLRSQVPSYFSIVARLGMRDIQVVGPDGSYQLMPQRFMTTTHDESYDWLKDHFGVLPEFFEVDFETDYQRISDLANGPDANPPAVAPAVESNEITDALRAGETPTNN